jgi:hypothetical protein
MQYWINHNGVQSGPVDADGIKELALTSRAYVWHPGLSDWVKITQVPELEGLFEVVDEPATVGQPLQPQNTAPAQQPMNPQPVNTQPEGDPEPCPPTNLVWAIITTVLCCLPAGIVAIIYAMKVTNKYREGDIEGAKRASEVGAWWCIASIILGILSMPLISLLQVSSKP